MNNCPYIPQPGDIYWDSFPLVWASTSRATVSGLTMTITYEAAPPTRTVLRRYELAPVKRCRVWEWVALPYAVLIGILVWKAGLFQ